MPPLAGPLLKCCVAPPLRRRCKQGARLSLLQAQGSGATCILQHELDAAAGGPGAGAPYHMTAVQPIQASHNSSQKAYIIE